MPECREGREACELSIPLTHAFVRGAASALGNGNHLLQLSAAYGVRKPFHVAGTSAPLCQQIETASADLQLPQRSGVMLLWRRPPPQAAVYRAARWSWLLGNLPCCETHLEGGDLGWGCSCSAQHQALFCIGGGDGGDQCRLDSHACA